MRGGRTASTRWPTHGSFPPSRARSTLIGGSAASTRSRFHGRRGCGRSRPPSASDWQFPFARRAAIGFLRAGGGKIEAASSGTTRGQHLLPNDLTRDLEELKLSLIRMRPDDLEATQSESIRQEISAIRLQLKRLELERIAIAEDVRRMKEAD